MPGKKIGRQISGALQEALVGQLTSEWPNTLTPEQFAMMAFSITAPEAVGLRATITFTDEAGYRWERTDNQTPRLAS